MHYHFGTASGENVALQDSADMTFKKLGVSGNTWQETREGKNLTNYEDWTRLSAVGTLSITEDTLTYNVANGAYGVWDIERTLEANTAYTASWECNFSGTFGSPHGMKAKIGETWTTISTSNILNFTTDSTGKTQLAFYVGSPYLGENATLVLKNIRLYKGTYAADKIADYEKYGAMPSENFTSRIRSCGDNINLFDKESFIEFYSATTGKDGEREYIAYTTSNNCSNVFMQNQFKENTQYTISLWGRQATKNAQGKTSGIKFIYADGTKSEMYLNNDEKWTKYELTSEVGKTIQGISLLWAYGGTIWMSEIKIEEGTAATPYSKCAEGNTNFTICNKNLFNKDNYKMLNGYLQNNSIFAEASNNTIYIPCSANTTYTVSKKIGKRFTVAYSNTFPEAGGTIEGTTYNHAVKSITITTNAVAKYLLVYIRNGNIAGELTLEEILDSLQIEENNVVTNLVEHKEQNITFPLKQKLHKTDYLAADGIHHKRAEIELDGITDRLKVSSVVKHTNNIYFCTISLLKPAINASSFYCSHLKNNTSAGVTAGNCYITGGGGILVLVLEDQTITTVEQANNWLAEQKTNGTPVVANYMLKEEELEEYSEEQKAIYDEIMQTARSYKEKTHIFSNDEISPIFDVEYVKDMECYINSKLNAAAVAEVEE